MTVREDEKVKLIAFHLPQFHTFPENDKWWGEGFTEWTNTRKARPLFPGHYQPREPLEGYYDLSRLEDMLRQMQLASRYGVYGFCYYHYWFNGKKLLHRPLEMIRDYRGEKLPYCLCWANEPWTRAWEGSSVVLMPQEYGTEKEWEEHFLYLLGFFKDEAYICREGCPVLVLYRCNSIPDCDRMISYWDRRCREEGFRGLYCIEEMNAFQEKPVCRTSSAVLEFEPVYTLQFGRPLYQRIMDKAAAKWLNFRYGNSALIYSYDRIWKTILKRKHTDLKKCFPGAFADWDNTPRKGSKSRFFTGSTPEKFEKYLEAQKKAAGRMKAEYIFLNAWNEWGEGTYLEPDLKYGYQYLEAVSRIFGPGRELGQDL